MSEIKQTAVVYLIDYICDNCGKGKMIRHGKINLKFDPPKFPHKCESCDYIGEFTTSYPTPKFEMVENVCSDF